ncbi:hypothetical protein Pla110_39290 [Polystyrenella longa]|uniref:Vitamin K-dependent gamma-carboxylase n=1 Tax=Polystyrenella longa TaxID=2528007 RepID=A0A518CSL7_9PLAN|nr:hypothetical protein [Polystyrenella longa]QDU82174.1 hypothetical protein Pla110_39290 [Polystyrenella longa]
MSAELQLKRQSTLPRLVLLERLMALFTLLLIGLTWPLWWGGNDFPMIPLLPGFSSAPLGIDRGVLGLLLISLCGFLVLPGHLRVRNQLHYVIPLLLFLLVILDQHRIQTWSYQFGFMYLLMGCGNRATDDLSTESVKNSGLTPERTFKLLQVFVASIYIYSALSKLTRHFITGGGFFLSRGLLEQLGIDTTILSLGQLTFITTLLPLFELLVGFCLLFRGLRRFALSGSILLHAALILTLGPWGLNHSAGVLIWNLFFIVQNLVLFGFPRPEPETASLPEAPNPEKPALTSRVVADRKKQLGYALFLLVILMPAWGSRGYWDHWLSWEVYTSDQEKFLILIEDAEEKNLPVELAPYLLPPKPLETMRFLNVNSWSLDTKHAPAYPQSRFQWGIWRDIQNRYPDLKTQIILDDAIDRFSVDSWRDAFMNEESIDRLKSRFLFNSTPRLSPRP